MSEKEICSSIKCVFDKTKTKTLGVKIRTVLLIALICGGTAGGIYYFLSRDINPFEFPPTTLTITIQNNAQYITYSSESVIESENPLFNDTFTIGLLPIDTFQNGIQTYCDTAKAWNVNETGTSTIENHPTFESIMKPSDMINITFNADETEKITEFEDDLKEEYLILSVFTSWSTTPPTNETIFPAFPIVFDITKDNETLHIQNFADVLIIIAFLYLSEAFSGKANATNNDIYTAIGDNIETIDLNDTGYLIDMAEDVTIELGTMSYYDYGTSYHAFEMIQNDVEYTYVNGPFTIF